MTKHHRLGWWGGQGVKAGYPRTTPERIAGVDPNLQERLDELYAEENERRRNRKDIGFRRKTGKDKDHTKLDCL